MNKDAERIISEQASVEEIMELLQIMKKLHEQLNYLIEILE